MKAAYITHPSFMRHEMGPHHPECPERLAAISDRLLLRGVLDVMDTLETHIAPSVGAAARTDLTVPFPDARIAPLRSWSRSMDSNRA